jgi:hypothetical protein
MAKIIQVRAPANTSIEKMSEPEIRKLVEAEADKYLKSLPAGLQPVGVSALSVSPARATGGGGGGWAEWTRACGNARASIDNYTDPSVGDIAEITAANLGSGPIQSILITRPANTPEKG